MSLWNTISGVTLFSQILQIGIILGAACCLISVFLLSRADRRMLDVREDCTDLSNKRLKSIESAAGGIRKELLDTQQERDIMAEKLKVMQDDYEKLQLALEDAVKKNANIKRIAKDRPVTGENQDTLNMDSAKTKKAVSPLSREQREQLIALLDPGPKGDLDILSIIGDDNSNMLAAELDEIFSADGWTTKGVAQSAFSREPEGIILSVHSKETAPSYASFIQRTMATIGFPVTAAVNNKYHEWSLTLIVGKIS